MTPTLVFDIETVPDVAGLRRVHALASELTDADVLDWALQQRRATGGSEFVPSHLQRVIAIACVLREGETLRIASVGSPSARVLEWRRIRPAGALASGDGPWHHRGPVLGLGR
jgi:3'-5' exonuclease